MNSLEFYKLRKQLFDEIDVVDKKIKEELDNIFYFISFSKKTPIIKLLVL